MLQTAKEDEVSCAHVCPKVPKDADALADWLKCEQLIKKRKSANEQAQFSINQQLASLIERIEQQLSVVAEVSTTTAAATAKRNRSS